MQTAVNQATPMTRDTSVNTEPVKIQKRIGSTLYMVNIHFSETNKETMNDKILRLIKSEAQIGKVAG